MDSLHGAKAMDRGSGALWDWSRRQRASLGVLWGMEQGQGGGREGKEGCWVQSSPWAICQMAAIELARRTETQSTCWC